MNRTIQLLLAWTLSSGLTLPAAHAQTGRIARLSHAGWVAEPGDNLGMPPSKSQHKVESLTYLNDSIVQVRSLYRSVNYNRSDAELERTPWQASKYEQQYYSPGRQQGSWEEAVETLRRQYPAAQLIDFDKPLKKHGKKPTGQQPVFRKRPFQYSYWRGLATVAALGAVGWLLGRKPKNV